jgi:hypothetical protein
VEPWFRVKRASVQLLMAATYQGARLIYRASIVYCMGMEALLWAIL